LQQFENDPHRSKDSCKKSMIRLLLTFSGGFDYASHDNAPSEHGSHKTAPSAHASHKTAPTVHASHKTAPSGHTVAVKPNEPHVIGSGK